MILFSQNGLARAENEPSEVSEKLKIGEGSYMAVLGGVSMPVAMLVQDRAW